MTFSEILSREENNWDCAFLYHEGIFLKAYQHSACLVHTQIHEFKLSYRYIKSVNENVFSLGFPKDSMTKWLKGHKVNQLGEKLFVCEFSKKLSETEYATWKEIVAVNRYDNYSPNTHIIEKAPLYKTANDLLQQIYSLSVNVSKNAQDPLGHIIKQSAFDMCFHIRGIYDGDHKQEEIELAIKAVDKIKFILQILSDMKEISLKSFALASERAVSVSKQLVALRRRVMAQAPGTFDSSGTPSAMK